MRNVQLTADQIGQLAMGDRVELTDPAGKSFELDGSQLSTDQVSALCESGRVIARDRQGADVTLVGVDLA
jgi:hypothetical protein